jgi:hypothetical protein
MIIAESYIEPDDILSEGANIEITKKLKEFKERYNKYNKAGKKALLKKDFNTAAENFAKAKKELKEFEYAVKNMDSTVGSAVLGSIAGLLIVMIKVTILSFAPFGIVLGGYKIYSNVTKDKFVYRVAKYKWPDIYARISLLIIRCGSPTAEGRRDRIPEGSEEPG